MPVRRRYAFASKEGLCAFNRSAKACVACEVACPVILEFMKFPYLLAEAVLCPDPIGSNHKGCPYRECIQTTWGLVLNFTYRVLYDLTRKICNAEQSYDY